MVPPWSRKAAHTPFPVQTGVLPPHCSAAGTGSHSPFGPHASTVFPSAPPQRVVPSPQPGPPPAPPPEPPAPPVPPPAWPEPPPAPPAFVPPLPLPPLLLPPVSLPPVSLPLLPPFAVPPLAEPPDPSSTLRSSTPPQARANAGSKNIDFRQSAMFIRYFRGSISTCRGSQPLA